jgi:hypothetical protein
MTFRQISGGGYPAFIAVQARSETSHGEFEFGERSHLKLATPSF